MTRTKPIDTSVVRSFLDKNNIRYVKFEDGGIAIDYNDVPKYLLTEFYKILKENDTNKRSDNKRNS